MAELELESDCERCNGLCCVAAEFEESEKFAFSKLAGVACHNLALDGRCKIYGLLPGRGLSGCVEYTCFGAGQNLVQNHFPGRHWCDGADIAEKMFATFYVLKELHELMWVLHRLMELNPRSRLDRKIKKRIAKLEGLARGTPASIRGLDVDQLVRENQDLVTKVEAARAADPETAQS